MSANTRPSKSGRGTPHSKSGGGMIWAAGFLFLLTAVVHFAGDAPDDIVSLDEAMGTPVSTGQL